MRNICSKTVPYCKGVTRRRWCGHNRLSHMSSTFHPIIQGGRLAWASYLWEKWQSLSSRGISFQSNVQHLKPTDTSSPFLPPFYRHVLVLFIINSAITPIWLRDYPPCSCWNLSLTCTLEHTHTCTHILREGSLKKPLSSDIGRSTYQIVPLWVHNKHHQYQAVAVSSSS